MSARDISILRRIGCLCILCILTACTSLLPDAKRESPKPWGSYFEVQWSFAQIIPNKTSITELNAMGIELGQTPNISVLSQADILKRMLKEIAPEISGWISLTFTERRKLTDGSLTQLSSSEMTP